MPSPRSISILVSLTSLTSAFTCLLPLTAHAWGPHPEITQTALQTLAPDDALRALLGPEMTRLPEYCWMADNRRSLRKESSQWFYADDYLLFPPVPTHLNHICPEVRKTYEPHFLRALQALRTESPLNAARWIGSILHFTEDTGSPPHAAEISGEVHSKMENWVDAKAIRLPDYRPALLGKTDAEALQGFLQRMEGLIAFSKQRAERARPFVLSGDRPSTEPIVLESALETSRVVADLLHTLGYLANLPSSANTSLAGRIVYTPSAGMEKLPAKVMLQGTAFSTIAEPDGRYAFHNLPAGNYRLVTLLAGHMSADASAKLTPNQNTSADLVPHRTSPSNNLVRNSALAALWLGTDHVDAWYRIKSRAAALHWEGEMLPLRPGASYRLAVEWNEGATGRIILRLRPSADFSKLPTELAPLQPGQSSQDFRATNETAYAQILIEAEAAPRSVCRSVSLSEVSEPH